MKFISLFALIGLAGLALTLNETAAAPADGRGELQTSYYPSGRLQAEYGYKDGVKEGPCRRYRPDGRVEVEGQFLAGRMDGEWRVWLADGDLDTARSGLYRGGERIGDVTAPASTPD